MTTSTSPIVWILVRDLDHGGVPEVLVRYLRWLRSERTGTNDGAATVHVIATRGGRHARTIVELAAGCTLLGPDEGRSRPATLAAATAQLGHPRPGRFVHDAFARHQVRRLPRPDVVLVHGAGAWPLWRTLEPAAAPCRLVLHLHELAIAIGRSVPPDEIGSLVADPEVIAAVCQPDDGLAALLGHRADDVLIVPGCTSSPPPPPPPAPGPGGAGSGADKPTEVVAIGEAGWRKGTDRFVALAHELARRRPDVRCRWIGASLPARWRCSVGASDPVTWNGPEPDPWAAVAPGSIVVVPSREDPLPLVALEAGARASAVVASGAGGLAELLADRRGWFVEGGDVRALADAVDQASTDAAEAAARGRALHEHVDRFLTPEAVGPRWREMLLGPSH